MTEEVAAQAADDQTAQAAVEAAVSSQEAEKAPERDWEAEARVSGWVPEEEFKGDKRPAKFLSAEEFVRRGEEITPFIKRENQRLKEELEAERKATAERFARMEKMQAETLKRQADAHKAELDRIKAQKREAAAAGDVKEFDRLEAAQADLEKKAPKADAPPPEVPPALLKFKEANPWYETDSDLTDFALAVSQRLAQDNPAITLEDNLRQTVERVKKAFPHKFEEGKKETTKPAANGHAAVDGGSSFPAAKVKSGPGSKLNAEEKSQAEKDVAAGLYKSVDEWATVYYS